MMSDVKGRLRGIDDMTCGIMKLRIDINNSRNSLAM